MLRPLNRKLFQAALGALVVMSLLKCLANTNADPDLWGYLAFGRLFWQSGQFPYQDVFSFVPTLNPWVYHEWLTGVLFYPLYLKLGGFGLQALKYVLALGTMALLFLTARLRGAEAVSAWLGLWFVQFLFIYGYSPVRAQIFTYFFFALSLYVLEKARLPGNRRWLALLIFLPIPWCNLHGGFVAGLGLLTLYALGEAVSRRPFWPYLGTLALAALATLINPYGLQYWTYICRAVALPRPEITEWASLWAAYQAGHLCTNPTSLAAIVIFAAILWWWAKPQEATPSLVLAVTLVVGIMHQRHLIFFLLATGAYLPPLLTAFLKDFSSRPLLSWTRKVGYRLPSLLLAALTLICTVQVISLHPWELKLATHSDGNKRLLYYPQGALAFLRGHHLSGNLLTEFDWGEYLLWNLYPQCLIAIDGRFETVYPQEVCRQYWNFKYARQDWRRFLTDYPPDLILIYKKSQVYPLVAQEAAWRQVYADTETALFIRQDSLRGWQTTANQKVKEGYGNDQTER